MDGAEGFYRTRSKSNTGTVMSGGTKRVLYVKNGVDGEITEGEEELRDGAEGVEHVVLARGVFLAESPIAALTVSPLPDDVLATQTIRPTGYPLPELLQSVETGLQAPNASLTAWNTPTGSTYAQDGSARPKDAPTAIRPTSSTADDDPYRSLRPLSATPTPIMTSPTSILQEDTLRVPPKRQVDQTTQTSIPTTPTTTPGKRPLPIPPSRSTSLASPTSTHTLEAGLGPATSTGTLAPSHDHSTHDHSTRDHSTTGLPLSDAMTLSQAARHSLHVIEPSAGLAVPRAPPEFYPPGPPSHAPESSEGFVPERSTSTTPDIKLPSNTLGTLPPHGTSGHASAYTQRPLPSPPNASVHSRLSGLSGTGSYSHAHTNHTTHTTHGTHTPVPSPTSAQLGSSTSDLPLLIASHLLSTHAASLMRHSATMRDSSELMRRLARESLDWGSMLMAMANTTRGREDGSLRGPSGFGLRPEPDERAFDGSGVNRAWRQGDTTRFEGLPPLPDLDRLSSMLARSAPLQDHSGDALLNGQNGNEPLSRIEPDRHLRRSSLPPKSSVYPTPPTSDLLPRASRDPHPGPEPAPELKLGPQLEPDFDTWDPRNDNFTQLPDRPSFVRDGRKRKGQSLPPAWYDAHKGVSPGGATTDDMRRPTQVYGTPREVSSSPRARENGEGLGGTTEELDREWERERTWSFSRSRENGWSDIATAGEEGWSLEAALRSLTPEGRYDRPPRETDRQRSNHTAAIRHPFAFAADSTGTEGLPARGAHGDVSTRGPEQLDEDDLAAFRISFSGPATMPTPSQLRLSIPNPSAHGHGHGHGLGLGQGQGQGQGYPHEHGHGVSPSRAFPVSSDVLFFGPGVACPPSPTGTPTPLETPRIGPPVGVVGLRLPSEDESEKDDVLGGDSGVVRAKSLLGQTSPTSPMRPTRPISTVSSAQTGRSQGTAGGVGGGGAGGPVRAGSRASTTTTARASGGRKLSKRTRPKGAGIAPGTGNAIPLQNIGPGDGTDGKKRPGPGQGTVLSRNGGSVRGGSVRGGPGRVGNAGGAGAPGKDVDVDAKSVGAEGEVFVREKRHWWSRRTSVVA
jgi:hypothetical protein